MRLPLYIVIPVCLLTAVLTFWIATLRIDFVTPPPEEKLLALQAALQEKHRPTDVSIYVPEAPKPRAEVVQTTPIPEDTPAQRFDPALAEIAPALDEYAFEAQSEAGYSGLFDLAQMLEEQGYTQRALLAWERILDTAAAPPNVHRQAQQAIARLRTSVPPWVADESEVITLALKGGATSIDTTTLATAMESLCALMDDASAGIVDFQPKLTVGGSANPNQVLPVAIWIAPTETNENGTPVLTFTPTNDDPAFISRSVSTIVYQLVKATIDRTARFRPLPDLSPADNPEDLLRNRVTRLQWRAFARAIQPPTSPTED